MKRLYRSTVVILALSLGACSAANAPWDGPVSPVEQQAASAPLTIDSTSEQIRQAMQSSATRWQTLWMDGTVTWYTDASTQVFHEQVWIEIAAARFRALLGPAEGEAETFKASDGAKILELDLRTGRSQSHDLPGFVRDPAPDAVPHPLWGQIGTPISEIALSSNYAVSGGTYSPTGLEWVAGRQALAVEVTQAEAAAPQWRIWLDTETAVILKLQEFAKGGGGSLRGERVVNQLVYNAEFDETLFGIPRLPPQFGDLTGALPAVQGTAPAPTSASGVWGELYFFTLPHQPGQSVQLVRLTGSCVVGRSDCLPLEALPVPFPFNFNLSALAWSPDGQLAAFAYSDHPAGTPTKLWLFDPEADNWKSIAEFPYLDPPFWSPDGMWIAFRVQDGQGGEAVYAIRRDGSDLRNLTASASLPAGGQPYVMDGWLGEEILMRSALPGSAGSLYGLRVSDGTVRPMFKTLLTKAQFVVSPDGAWLVYDDYGYNSQEHALRLIKPDGTDPVELMSFAGGSVYPLVWSPDGSQIAFAHSSSDANFNPVSEVYVIGQDGRGMAQVYRGTTVGRILFSPDGQYLLVEETTSPTGGHLFCIDLATLEQRILSAPGLTLDTDWYAPAWRPR